MPDDLGGKVALVTGGARGIGAAIARRLAQGGARVTICYSRDAEGAGRLVDALTSEGFAAAARQADHDDPAAASDCVAAVVQREGRLDILVNNAAVGELAPLSQVTAQDAERQVRINLIAPLLAIREAAPHLIRTGGCVVSVSSINAQNPVPGASVYCATKAGWLPWNKDHEEHRRYREKLIILCSEHRLEVLVLKVRWGKVHSAHWARKARHLKTIGVHNEDTFSIPVDQNVDWVDITDKNVQRVQILHVLEKREADIDEVFSLPSRKSLREERFYEQRFLKGISVCLLHHIAYRSTI